MTHSPSDLKVRVYYEDTDAGGVTYYANYLKYAERARTEWIREIMGRKGPLWTKDDPIFVVRRVEADYIAPAHHDDSLVVTTKLIKMGGASFVMEQNIQRDGQLLVALKVTLVTITHDGKVLRLPAEWRQKLQLYMS